MSATSMLSLCCGALPVGGVVRTYQTYHSGHIYHLGHCTLCGGHIPFALGGELETSPKWLRLPPLHALPKTELRAVGNGKGHYTSDGADADKLPPLHEWPKPLPDKWLCSMGSAGLGYYTSDGVGKLLPAKPKLCAVCDKPVEDQGQPECYECWNKDVDRLWNRNLWSNGSTTGWWLCIALAGWLAFVLLSAWSALHRHRQGEAGQGGFKGSFEEPVGSSHAPQTATKGQGGKQ